MSMCVCVCVYMRRGNRLLSIEDEEDGAGAHQDKVFVENSVRDGVLKDVDYNYPLCSRGTNII